MLYPSCADGLLSRDIEGGVLEFDMVGCER